MRPTDRSAKSKNRGHNPNGWRVTTPNTVVGIFKGARAIRSPCSFGIPWTSVITRRVKDLSTGILIDEYDARIERLSAAEANRRLLHVADIAIDVTHKDERGVCKDFLDTAARWADESEDEYETHENNTSTRTVSFHSEGAAEFAHPQPIADVQRGVQTGRPSRGKGQPTVASRPLLGRQTAAHANPRCAERL